MNRFSHIRCIIPIILFLLLTWSLPNLVFSAEYLRYQFNIVKEFTEHKDPVNSVVFSPDGRFLASASMDSNAKLWQGNTGKQIRALMRHPSPLLCAAFNPDGNILAVGSENGNITLWDVNYKERIRVLKGHEDSVQTIRFSPNGFILASGSADKTIKLWDMDTGKEIKSLKGHTDTIYSITFSPNSVLLASGSADGSVTIWDIGSGIVVAMPRESGESVNSVCFSPDGGTLALGLDDASVRLWNTTSKSEVDILSGHQAAIGIDNALSFSPDGRLMASAASDKKVLIWDLDSKAIANELTDHKSEVSSVSFSPDGKHLASAAGRTVIIYNINITEILEITLDADYEAWQRGTLNLKASVIGLPDMVKFQYSTDASQWVNIAKLEKPPYGVDWNTRESILKPAKKVQLRVVAERNNGTKAMDIADGSFSLDNEPPVTKHDYDGKWHTEDFSVNLSANDNEGVGLLATKYRLNYGEEKNAQWDGQPYITDNGKNTLEFWSVDKLGNEGSHEILADANLDKLPPSFMNWTRKPENLPEDLSGSINVSIRVLDEDGSGLEGKIPQFDYHIGNEMGYDGYEDMAQESDDSWHYQIPEPDQGWSNYLGQSIYYKAKCQDVAGNTGISAEQQQPIGSTKAPPTVRITSSLSEWENGILAIAAEASDIDGMIKEIKFEYSIDNISWALIGSTEQVPYSIQWDTSKDMPEVSQSVWVRAIAMDSDGLQGKYISTKFVIDNQPPTTGHNYDGKWQKNNYTINLKADDGDGSGVAETKYKRNNGYERIVAQHGQPDISEQGISKLEYWSIDKLGNEEAHKILNEIKLDRLPPSVDKWEVNQDGSKLHVQIQVIDTDSGISSAPQISYRIGSDNPYSGYKDMQKMDDGIWKYIVDTANATGNILFCKVSAKDAVGNLNIKRWEYNIPIQVDSTQVTPTEPESQIEQETKSEPEPEQEIDIKPIPVVEEEQPDKQSSSITWTTKPGGQANVGEKLELVGRLEPRMNKRVPLSLTVSTPDSTSFVSQIDSNLDGTFEFDVELTARGKWMVSARWSGDSSFEPARSKIIQIETIEKRTGPSATKKATSFLKKNTMIVGIVFLYVIIIRLYRN